MKINYERSFLRDIKGLRDKKIKQKLENILMQFTRAGTIDQIQQVKKLKDFSAYYRLRIADYRLGFRYENNEATMIRFIHRKDIYKLFP